MSDRTRASSQISDAVPDTRPVHRAGIWLTLGLFLIVFFALLVFIAQNSGPVEVRYFGSHAKIGLSAALLIAAVAGAFLVALVATMRAVQMRLRPRA